MKCPECSTLFKPRRLDQTFCSKACRQVYTNREMTRSRVLYSALYHWRVSRETAKDDLRFICREIAEWVRLDKEAGRGKPPRHNHGADRGLQTRRYTEEKPLVA